ncbi:division/cell wall cluster transcriptional repressor MraZ [Methyloversatilis sp.]|uniref:division/cell wall cluster transcriptional repressor MraZ n=1 Tax=Methyloversatilis sp. TaxID=2569862 RepID=UPI002736DEB9|nr:division/cell wall cluster transcriptional repressor MraZ [Methyloversatilis sp.]MDP2869391.1 division/cell wall cluster transcriptional repressor MraZ [Methyloversatilis sp.]MDP3290043.1 division/cell wall cluster transcriptional repressor MraZ [Methyloversatilis sp.]MDP3455962.1 division/cell wall cluster transcriptional repressor MraZ [Methyloversatilis sp.]MDP3580053.1 division/cell wall cluster transcriptional repressor MraZ [Methyloversatilis sp.]
MFYGTTRLTMDDKHRLVVPARPRKKLLDLCGGEVVMTARTREFVLLYPEPEFLALMSRLEVMPDLNQASDDFKRSFTANARNETIDRAGRLLLCSDLRERAGLNKSVMLVGRGNRFEIWDEARWNEEARARDEREQAAELPPDVVGNFRF